MEKMRPVVFVGSGEASLLERKVLIYSIRKNTPGGADIAVFNGTHNSVERDGQPPQLAPMSLRAKYFNITEFSNYRFLIPELCGYSGRALYVDSDMICLTDINDLFGAPMNGADMLAKAATGPEGDPRWGTSVTLYDCATCRFDLERYIDDVRGGLYGYNDLHQLSARFLKVHPFKVGALDPNWNSYDALDGSTKLIHYTNLHTQPWKYRGHPHGAIWFQYLKEALEAGYVTEEDIEISIRRAYVRFDIRKGNTIGLTDVVKNALSDLRAAVRDTLRTTQG